VEVGAKTNGYRGVAEALQERIRTGSIPVGALLPTERELVEVFGVSRGTVRRALAHLVHSGWAESLPNRGVAARIGRGSNRRQVIGFVDHADAFEPHLFFALNLKLQGQGLVLAHVDSQPFGTESAIEYCLDQGFAGAIVWSKTINPDRERLGHVLRSIPIIAVDHPLRGLDTDLVACDVYEAAKVGVQHLVQSGAQRVALAGMLDSLETTQERFGGYLEGMFVAGQQPETRDFFFTRTSGSTEGDISGLERRLREPDRPDAIFVMQDHILDEVLRAVENIGLRVPEDLRIVTMGSDEPSTRLPSVGITTMAFDWSKMAEALVQMCIQRLANPSAPSARSLVNVDLVVRGSCGAPPTDWSRQPTLPLADALRRLAGDRPIERVSDTLTGGGPSRAVQETARQSASWL